MVTKINLNLTEGKHRDLITQLLIESLACLKVQNGLLVDLHEKLSEKEMNNKQLFLKEYIESAKMEIVANLIRDFE